ncbi:MAG: hypothetical protein KG003_15445 [Bacteroidetes bacterium]|nr:hypothetical protein [Bacteroidota bacterium]
MKKTLLTAGLACMAFSLHAQNETELLQNYKYRFQQYRRYGFSLNGSNGFYGYDHNYRGNTSDIKYTTNQNANLSFGLNRYYLSNTDRNQYSTSLMLGFNGSTNKKIWEGNSKNYDEYLYYNIQNRIYKVPNKFLFYDITANINDRHNRDKNTPVNTNWKYNNYDNSYTSLNVNLGFGRGRLEYVSDVSFALFWLADMQKKGIIGSYNNENVHAIAKALTKTRNTRIMDFRFNTIGQMEMLDSAFQNSGMLKKKDASYYTTLYDHYLYANNYTRYHGKRLEYGINLNPSYYYYYNIYQYDTSVHHLSYMNKHLHAFSSLYILRTVNQAVSLKNQLNYYYGFNIGQAMQNYHSQAYSAGYSTSEFNGHNPYAAIKAGIEWQRFLNSRNSISTGIDGSLNAASFVDPNSIDANLNMQARAQYYHWFSPSMNLALRGSLSTSYHRDIMKNNWNSDHDFNENFSFSFNYLFY